MIYPHAFTAVDPATSTDTHNNTVRDYGTAATRTANVPGWMQQNQRGETFEDGRNPATGNWLLFTSFELDRYWRVEWGGSTYEVDGQPNPLYTPVGLHHYEVSLRIVEG